MAFDAGGKRDTLSMDILTIPAELFTKFQTSFYAEPVDAVLKALGESERTVAAVHELKGGDVDDHAVRAHSRCDSRSGVSAGAFAGRLPPRACSPAGEGAAAPLSVSARDAARRPCGRATYRGNPLPAHLQLLDRRISRLDAATPPGAARAANHETPP